MKSEPLTADRLRVLLNYDPETGLFTRPQGMRKVGTQTSNGYTAIGIDGRYYKAHRLAWLYVYGEWPSSELDHKNRVKTDNRIDNLRVATRSQNTMNRGRARTDNKLGVLGVTQIGSRFIARIVVDGEHRYLGIYRTPEAAGAAYVQAKQEHTS